MFGKKKKTSRGRFSYWLLMSERKRERKPKVRRQETKQKEIKEEQREKEKKLHHERILREFHLVPVRLLGTGTYGTVYQVRSDSDGQEYAAKILDPVDFDLSMNIGAPEGAVMEATNYRHIGVHPNITRLYRVFYDRSVSSSVVLLLELATLGDLAKVTDQFWEQTSEKASDRARRHIPQQVQIARDLVCAVAQVHASGLIFFDLKPHNVLVFDGYQAKLSDLGDAYRADVSVDAYESSDQSKGTLWWRSPEEECGKFGETPALSYARDMWSLGLIFLDLFWSRPQPMSSASVHADLFPAWVEFRGWPSKAWYRQYDARKDFCPLPPKKLHQNKTTPPLPVSDEKILRWLAAYYDVMKIPKLFQAVSDVTVLLLNWNPEHRLTPAKLLQYPLFTSIAEQLGVESAFKCSTSAAHKPSLSRGSPTGFVVRDFAGKVRELYGESKPFDFNAIAALAAEISARYQPDGKLTQSENDAAVIIALKAYGSFLKYWEAFKELFSEAEASAITASEQKILNALDWNIDGPKQVGIRHSASKQQKRA